MKIGIIGTGNMGGALMDAFCLDPNNTLRAYNHGREKLEAVCGRTGAIPAASAADAIDGCDVILLAVKPIVMPSVLEELAPVLRPEQLVVSIAVGLTIESYSKILGPDKKIQIKPNGSICISITCAILFCNHFCRKPLLHVPNGLDSDKIYLIFIAAFFIYRIVSCHLSNIQINPNRSVQPFFCCVFLHCFFYIFQRNVQPGYFQCHR